MFQPLSKMHLYAIIFVFILEKYSIYAADTTSLFPRLICFRNVQENCNKEFIDAYPQLSKSASGTVNASTWFLLYTRDNPEQPELLHKCGGELPPHSKFNRRKRLIIIIIPFNTAYCDVAVYREWKLQFLQREDANILVIDYGWGNHLEYGLAVENARIVANQSLIVLKNIQDKTRIRSSKIYAVGHSLGAQLAGLLGGLWYKERGTLFHRISALDAAGPGFAESAALADRLDRSDAMIVDVVHTNAGDCLPNFGINYDAGDVDFYVNGGSIQLSCLKYAFISLIKGDLIYGISSIALPPFCFHDQSTQYYKVSINPGDCQFVGVECNSYDEFKSGNCRSCGTDGSKCAIMGFDFEKYYNHTAAHRTYYLDTSLDCPYCDNSNIALEGFAATYNSSLQSN